MIKLILSTLLGNFAIAMLVILTLLSSCDSIEAHQYQEKFINALKEYEKSKKRYTKHLMNLDHLPPKPTLTSIHAINNFINTLIVYRKDISDLWQAPWDTIEKGYGDCEDFAILKYVILKEHGIDPKAMELIAASYKDSKREGHAYLKVDFEGKTYHLDNNTNNIFSPPKDYIARFSISEHEYKVFINQAELIIN